MVSGSSKLPMQWPLLGLARLSDRQLADRHTVLLETRDKESTTMSLKMSHSSSEPALINGAAEAFSDMLSLGA